MTGSGFQLGRVVTSQDFCGPGRAVTTRDFSWAGPGRTVRPEDLQPCPEALPENGSKCESGWLQLGNFCYQNLS